MSDTTVQLNITGRKVFFLYPTASIQNQIITELAQQEYEAYIIKNHSRFARALKKYPDSVLFINIDDGMSVQDWEKWVASALSSSPNIKIGAFSSNTDEEFRDKHTGSLHVTCGFMTLKVDMSKTTAIILETLNTLEAKGRRKYLRASTEHETNATINMPHGGGYINGVIKDISVVGISCAFELDPVLAKNALLKNIQVRLQTMLLKVEAVVFGSRVDNGETIYVLLFTQRVDPDIKIKIRKYIQQNLQHKIDQEIN